MEHLEKRRKLWNGNSKKNDMNDDVYRERILGWTIKKKWVDAFKMTIRYKRQLNGQHDKKQNKGKMATINKQKIVSIF